MLAYQFLLAILISVYMYCTVSCYSDFYSSWKQPKSERDDLFCNFVHCKAWAEREAKSVDECCVCHTKTAWEFPENESDNGYLDLEYVRRSGVTKIIEPRVLDRKYYRLIHAQGFMKSFPVNLCNFPYLVNIDFSNNRISYIDGISCVSKLDTLSLRGNLIRYVRNSTFEGLAFLRYLDLSENVIEKIEPFTFSKPELGLLDILLPDNLLRTIDMSNMALGKPFCSINANNNQITSFVNEGGLLINDSTSYGQGGMVYLNDNEFTTFPEFNKLGIPDLAVLGKLAQFGFDFRGAKWVCDSNMVPFLQLLEDLIRILWRDYYDVKCHLPERLRGESIPKLVLDKRLNEFISEISGKEGCPNFCTCIFYPVSNITNVKCYSSLMYMPNEMPEDGKLDIDFSETSIRQLSSASYLGRIRKINLSGTSLTHVPFKFLNGIETTILSQIDLSKTNHLDRITTDFKIIHHCNVHFGRKTIFCNCDNQWIQEWIDTSSCQWNSTLTCRTRKGLVSLSELSNALGCEEENLLFRYLSIAFSIVLLLFTMTLGTVYMYRYEIRILLKQNKDPDKIEWEKYKFDVYISFDRTNEQQMLWIFKIFLPDLRRSGYRVHFPLIDALPGSAVDEEVIGNMNRSRSFMIFLSNEYIADLNDFDSIGGIRTNLEWRHAWHFYRKSRECRLIIINYGFHRLCEVNRRELKAFLRVGKVLDFANKKHTLMTEVKELLGVPKIKFKGLGARNKIFNVKKEYLATENNIDKEFDLKVYRSLTATNE